MITSISHHVLILDHFMGHLKSIVFVEKLWALTEPKENIKIIFFYDLALRFYKHSINKYKKEIGNVK